MQKVRSEFLHLFGRTGLPLGTRLSYRDFMLDSDQVLHRIRTAGAASGSMAAIESELIIGETNRTQAGLTVQRVKPSSRSG